jgi:hypothetical protein
MIIERQDINSQRIVEVQTPPVSSIMILPMVPSSSKWFGLHVSELTMKLDKRNSFSNLNSSIYNYDTNAFVIGMIGPGA